MPKTLLVVDDSATIREAAKLALTGEGWSVLEAATSDEALSLLRAQAPDAVLCDVALGEEDGYELCRRIHLLPEGAGVPVVLLGSRVSQAAATAVGAVANLVKPFGSDELTETLRSALDTVAFDLAFSDLDAGAEGPLVPETGFPDFAGDSTEDDLEIIELSSGEDFEDLELLEDLEPVELATGPQRPVPLEEQGEEPEAFAARLQEPVELSASFEESEDFLAPGKNALLDEALGDELSLELDAFRKPAPREESAAPAAWPEPESDSADLEPSPSAEAEPPPPPPPGPSAAGPEETDLLAAQIARTAEEAARTALEKSLSAERLLPAVEAIVQRVVWEVVPPLAERLIQEAIDKLRQEPPPA
ncbi:MAG: response regulator [Deltaproteobacteria bacterium]|nr:response regulator [Deltaproteobacteria bacterium]